jgi:hypothetical protein
MKRSAELLEKILEKFSRMGHPKTKMGDTYIKEVFKLKRPYYIRAELTDEFIQKDGKIIQQVAEQTKRLIT